MHTITSVILSLNIFLIKVDSIEWTSLPCVGTPCAIPSDIDLSYFDSSIYSGILEIYNDYEMEGKQQLLKDFYQDFFLLQWILLACYLRIEIP